MYDAFLCYSRDQDTELAIALRQGLLHLGRRWYRRRALKDVFRDDSNLAAGPLWHPIKDALDTSRYLVLLASKKAAGSEYVERELSYWCEHREAENLLIVVTEPRPGGGDPPGIAWDVERNDFDWSATTVLPRCLSGVYPTQPRWIGLPRTTPRLSIRDPTFRLSVANVAARLHGRSVDDLIAEDIRQQRRRVIFIVNAVAAVFIAAIVAVIFGITATNAKNEAQRELRTAVAGRLLAQADALRETDPGAALRLGLAADVVAEGSSDHGAIGQETAAGLVRTLGTAPGLLIGQPIRSGTAYSVAYSPGGLLAIGGDHGVVSLWDTADRAHPRERGDLVIGNGKDYVTSLAFLPDGRTLAAAAGATVVMVDARDPGHLRPRSQPLSAGARYVLSLAVSADGRILAAGETGGMTILWDVTDPGRPVPSGTLTGPTADVNSVAFTPAGRILATGSTDHTVRLWDLAAARPVQLGQPMDSRIGPISSLTFSPDGRTLAAGAESPYGSVVLWDITDRRHPRRGQVLYGQEESVRALAFSPDGQRLAIGGTDNTITQYDVTNPDQPRWLGAPLTGHTNAVVALAFTPDSHTLASGSYDGTVMLFDTSRDSYRPRLLGTRLTGQTTAVSNVAYSPDGHLLATGSIRPQPGVLLWDVRDPDHTGRPHKLATSGTAQVSALAFSRDSRTLAVADGLGTVSLWDVAKPADPEPVSQISLGNLAYISSVAFSPDGHHLAAAVFTVGFIGVRFWDIRDRSSPRQQGQFKPPDQYGPMSSVTYSPDGSRVAVGTYNGAVDLVDPPAGYNAPYREYTGHHGPVLAVAYNPAGTLLASASTDDTILLWEVYDHSTRLQRIGQPLTGHANKVDAVAFSPDGKLLASGSYDNSIILWLVADPTHPAQLTQPLIGRVSPVQSVAFSRDGRTLATGTNQPGLTLWDIDPLIQALANPRRTACSLTGGLDQATWNSYAPEIPYRAIC